jgi:hypothetical protein
VSSALVASSRIKMRGFFSTTRAMANRCFAAGHAIAALAHDRIQSSGSSAMRS